MDAVSIQYFSGSVVKMLLAIVLLSSVVSAANEPEIDVAIGQNEVFVGDSIDFQVEVRNSKNPSPPDMTAVKQLFDVMSAGDSSRNQSSTFFVNGRMSKQESFSHVYQYRLTPKTAGSLTIPSVSASIDGKLLTSRELSIRVIETEEQDLVIVELEASHSRVYPTQPFTVTVRVLVQPLPKERNRDPLTPVRNQPPHLQINWIEPIAGLSFDDTQSWLQPLLADDGVGFRLNNINTRSIFDRQAVFNFLKGRETRNGLDGKPISYFVYELTRTITPQKPGEYSFGPAIAKGIFVAGIDQREYTGRKLVVIAPPAKVEVREVPVPRPATFCGGIGEYKVTASASPTRLRVGDPLTLTLDVERGPQSGSLELISAPDLLSIPEIASDFELIDRNPTGRVEGRVKKFSYAMRPKKANITLPSLVVSTFDPNTEQFMETQTAPIPLEVSEGSRITGGDLVGKMPASPSTSIKSRSEGIFQNITDPREMKDERISIFAWSAFAGGVWFLAVTLIGVVTVYRHKVSDPQWLRRQQARKVANRRLGEAKKLVAAGHLKQALLLVRNAIVGFVADLQNRIAEGLTTSDIATALDAAAVPNPDRATVLQLLETIESAEYGGAESIEAASTIENASTLIVRIAPFLEKGLR